MKSKTSECFLAKLRHGLAPTLLWGDRGKETLGQPKPVSVEILNLHKSFKNTPVLRGINLRIEPGETFFIIGPSGTGKSVLLKHLADLERQDSGMVVINGKNIHCEGPLCEERDYRYSMVFQTSALLNSLTVGENVGLWLREKSACPESKIKKIIQEKLTMVGLQDTEDRRTYELSGGMKKRVAIARALAMNPDLVLYDEPTAELDPVTTDELAKVIEKIKADRSMTSVVVSHDLNFAMYLADRIAMIQDGEIVEVGTPSEIKSSDNEIVRNFIYTTTKGLNKEES